VRNVPQKGNTSPLKYEEHEFRVNSDYRMSDDARGRDLFILVGSSLANQNTFLTTCISCAVSATLDSGWTAISTSILNLSRSLGRGLGADTRTVNDTFYANQTLPRVIETSLRRHLAMRNTNMWVQTYFPPRESVPQN
jgi:hypothetical protein